MILSGLLLSNRKAPPGTLTLVVRGADQAQAVLYTSAEHHAETRSIGPKQCVVARNSLAAHFGRLWHMCNACTRS